MNPVMAVALDMLESVIFGMVIYPSVVYIRALWHTPAGAARAARLARRSADPRPCPFGRRGFSVRARGPGASSPERR